MKKLNYILLFALFPFVIYSCSKNYDNSNEELSHKTENIDYKGIKNVEEFENLYKQQVEPFNNIVESTFLDLKSSIYFDANNIFRGFENTESLNADLDIKEISKLFTILSGEEMVLIDFPAMEYYYNINIKRTWHNSSKL